MRFRFWGHAATILCLACSGGMNADRPSELRKAVIARSPDAVIPVRVTDGVPFLRGRISQLFYEVAIVRVSGLEPNDFMPTAVGGRFVFFDDGLAMTILSPVRSGGRATYIVPRESTAKAGFLWATVGDVTAAVVEQPDPVVVEALRIQAQRESPYWYSVTLPAKGGNVKIYPTLGHLELDEAPLLMTRIACERELGKHCGKMPDSRLGAVDCGACPSGEACTQNNLCCVRNTCAGVGAQCGNPPDGCGGHLSCGSCAGGAVCDADSYQCE